LGDYNVGLVVEVDTSEAFGAIDAMLTAVLTIFAIATVLIFIVGFVFSNTIRKPITNLVGIADKLALGDVSVEVKSDSKDEIGQLMSSFEAMVENIQGQAAAAEKIAAGELDIEIVEKSEKDVLALSMKQVVNVLNNLVDETNTLVEAAIEGSLDTRGNTSGFSGGYLELVNGVNQLTDTLVSHIDNIPIPVMIIDNKYRVKYMNTTGLKVLDTNPEKLLGNKCYDFFKTGDCNTDKCACNQAMAKDGVYVEQTDAHPNGMDLDIEYTGLPIKNRRGEVIGALEVVVDQTDIMNAQRVQKKQAEYQAAEVDKLMSNLEELAQGNLKINPEVALGDKDTAEIRENFLKISSSLGSMTDSISGYITEISEILTEMANNNLDVGIDREYLGDFNQIKESLNYIIEQFNIVLSEIQESANQVGAGAQEVADSSQSLSQGSTEQASSVEEISASITQVAAQTKNNAENANRASEIANQAKDRAQVGNRQMKEMLKAMQEINESSNNISKIIKVIDDIAFQTNILALNAAVEAARAGEHGKGFAVVAEEVRNLAARSAQAAKETTDMIDDSIKKAEDGTGIANETAKALEEIVAGVSAAVEIVDDISSASNEQASAITQINEGVNQVSAVTQANTATAEESASASEEMSSQAELLNELVGQFSLKGAKTVKPKAVKKEKVKVKKGKLDIRLDDDEFGKY